MKSVQSVYEAKAHLSSLLTEVASTGVTLVIGKHGVPIADLVPHRAVNDPFEVKESLAGAEYLTEPTAPLAEDDWPEALR
jgi:prevent-host-death family protein